MGIKELNRPAFRRLLVGQTVSSFGDWMGTFALMYLVLELSGSTTAVGGVLVVRLLPSALGAPLAARVVTRWRRRGVMMTADLVRAGMAVALPVLPSLWWVYAWAFAIEVVSLMFLPARDAAVPLLVGGRGKEPDTGTLQLANGVTMATSYGMIPFGAGTFGALLYLSDALGWTGHGRYVAVFWVDAATYLVSFAAIRGMPDLGPWRGERRPAGDGGVRAGAGFLTALRMPVVAAVLPGMAVVSLGLGALFSVGVPFVRDVLHAGPIGFGGLVALFGVGAIMGVLGTRVRQGGDLLGQVRICTALQGLVIAAMGALASTAWAFLGAMLFGAAAIAALIGGITYLQESLGGAGRTLGLTAFHAVLRFGLATAALVSGVADDLLGQMRHLPLGVAPASLVLIVSGLVVCCGTFLVRRPAREDRAMTNVR
ncbi:Predicted arabinose efflux permease, MFS family [Thermomonospora echinospora]|uniref:Predicted arabinose efflux permease, MFS family n=1 Tax=Thermomonospora echinospora TaxID=1992 RepID=A0A1H6D7T9_9ACTN|nr:MFS transporter [Thermomonospora echinospora]SEG81359.1 Predicted arabinose efflux permease, MFS family [Thermomonospora echinospora]